MDLTDKKACLVLVHGIALQLELGFLLSSESDKIRNVLCLGFCSSAIKLQESFDFDLGS